MSLNGTTKNSGELSVKQAGVSLDFYARLEDAIAAGGSPESIELLGFSYNQMTRPHKTSARHRMEQASADAVLEGDFARAQVLLQVKNALVRKTGSVTPRVRNHRARRATERERERTVEYLAATQIAYSLLYEEAEELEGKGDLPASWRSDVAALATKDAAARAERYADFIRSNFMGEEPSASEHEKAAARIACRRSPSGQGRKPRGAVMTGAHTKGEQVPMTDGNTGLVTPGAWGPGGPKVADPRRMISDVADAMEKAMADPAKVEEIQGKVDDMIVNALFGPGPDAPGFDEEELRGSASGSIPVDHLRVTPVDPSGHPTGQSQDIPGTVTVEGERPLPRLSDAFPGAIVSDEDQARVVELAEPMDLSPIAMTGGVSEQASAVPVAAISEDSEQAPAVPVAAISEDDLIRFSNEVGL